MAGQEVSLSLAHRCMRHASAEFMGLHKCKADTTPQAKLTPEDRVTLFMDNSFARYCAFNHLQNGDIVQVSVPSVWREAVTIIGGDEDEPIFVEGIEVINSPKPSGKTYFVAQSSRWVTADVAKKAKRLVFAQTYLVRFSTQNGYKAELLLDNNDWLNSEKVRQACLKLAELYDDEINLCFHFGRLQIQDGKDIKASWCVGMRKFSRKAIVCDLDNGMLQFINWDDINCLALKTSSVKTDFVRLVRVGVNPLCFERQD